MLCWMDGIVWRLLGRLCFGNDDGGCSEDWNFFERIDISFHKQKNASTNQPDHYEGCLYSTPLMRPCV